MIPNPERIPMTGRRSAMSSTVFYANTGSRRGAEGFDEAKVALETAGVKLAEARAFDEAPDLIEAVGQAAAHGTQVVIVGGGDGSLSASLKAMVKTGSTLGVMPLGTGNQFARDLDIPSDITRASQIIAAGFRAKVVVTELNGAPFLNVATLGLSTLIARNLDPTAKKLLGKLAYAVAVFRALRKMKPFHAQWELPSGPQAFDIVQMVVGNGRLHAGPFPLAPDASIADGLLDGYAIRTGSKLEHWKAAMMLPFGGHVNLDSVPAFRATNFRMTTQPKVGITVDGEEVWHDKMEFIVQPSALSVIIPETFRVPDERREPRLEF